MPLAPNAAFLQSKDFRTSILDLCHSADEMEKVRIYLILPMILKFDHFYSFEIILLCSRQERNFGLAQKDAPGQLIGLIPPLYSWNIYTAHQIYTHRFGKLRWFVIGMNFNPLLMVYI